MFSLTFRKYLNYCNLLLVYHVTFNAANVCSWIFYGHLTFKIVTAVQLQVFPGRRRMATFLVVVEQPGQNMILNWRLGTFSLVMLERTSAQAATPWDNRKRKSNLMCNVRLDRNIKLYLFKNRKLKVLIMCNTVF